MFKNRTIYPAVLAIVATISIFTLQALAEPGTQSGNQNLANATVGIQLSRDDQGNFHVAGVLPGSAAQKSGVSVGDRLIRIDGMSPSGTLSSVQRKLRRSPGEAINLTFFSPGSGEYTRRITRQSSQGTSTGTAPPKQPQLTGTTSVGTNAPAHSALQTQWTSYTNQEKTVSMRIPDGWEVKVDSRTGKIEVYSYDDESLTVVPFFLPGTRIDSGQARGLFNAMIHSLAKNKKWSSFQQVGQNGLRATSQDGSISEVVSVVFHSTPRGTFCRFMKTSAPKGFRNNYGSIFSTILSSLRISPAPNQVAAQETDTSPLSNLSWSVFVDPKQNAFSLEVPRGWNVSGGMEQPMAVDTRGWVRVISPDNKIIVFIGDPKVPTFTLPTMQLTSLGFPPGANYSPGYGLNTIVSYYMPAHKFVPTYGMKSLKKLGFGNIRLEGVTNHPNLAQQWNADKGAPIYSASSCKISAIHNGTPVSAYFLGSTRKDSPLWFMTLMTGIVCSADREAQAMQVFLHMYKTFKMNLNWQQGQLNLTKKFSRMMFQTWREINQIMRDSYNYRSAIQDRTHRKVVNALRGTQDVVDPGTGTVYNIESGSNYHWLNADGRSVLGTNQVIYPGANWTQLVDVP